VSQVVDTETAREFMKETLEKIQEDELVRISSELAIKSAFFQKKLSRENLGQLSKEEVLAILRSMFCTRRRAAKILNETLDYEDLKKWIGELLYEKAPIQNRFQGFYDRLGKLESNIRYDLAGELLHFTFPEKYWMWSHWMWNPKTMTGSIPLVTTDDFDLRAPSTGEMYLNVGKGVAFVHEVGEAAGFQTISRSLFGTDVFLSCVYVIYAYTVLRMRMTQEFNQVMPNLQEFSRRILGVHRMKEFEIN